MRYLINVLDEQIVSHELLDDKYVIRGVSVDVFDRILDNHGIVFISSTRDIFGGNYSYVIDMNFKDNSVMRDMVEVYLRDKKLEYYVSI
jgi:hypothetical protein